MSRRSHDRNVSGEYIPLVALQKLLVIAQATFKLEHLETGMAQRLARGAHNSEVTRSKRVAGIFITSHRCIKVLAQLYPRVRLRDYKQSGYGLIVNT